MPRPRQPIPERFCLTCKKALTYRQAAAGGDYCSLECRNSGSWRQNAGRPQRGQIHYVCKHCGEAFTDRRHGERAGRIYCSRRCANLASPSRSQVGSQGERKFIDGRSGYVILTNEKGRLQFEHRAVMERILGRKLKPFPQETVHHKNGDKTDNRPENLELWTSNHGAGQRVNDLPLTEDIWNGMTPRWAIDASV